MAAAWTDRAETGRLGRPVYNFSGEPCVEWDSLGGQVMRTTWGEDRFSRHSGLASRQRNTSESAYAYCGTAPHGYPDPFVHGAGPAGHHDPHYRPLEPKDHSKHDAQVSDWQAGPQGRLSSPHHGRRPAKHQKDSEAHLSPYAVAGIKNALTDWGSAKAQIDETWSMSSRRPTRSSISDRSDVTVSSRSDGSSPRSIAEDLQGLGLGDHPFSQSVPSPGASPRSQRWDPILGDVQRNHDTLVRLSLEPSYVIPGSTGEHETLDPRYKRQSDPRRFFRVGRVFAMLWHENAGLHGTVLSQKGPVFTKGKYQEPIYSSIRRMVVIKEQKGCCWCIPITTYSGQGVAKVGVDRSKHAVIHMCGSNPAMKKNEPKMSKEPLEVEPARPDQKLDPMSRLNFGKVYTVEHNVKVLPVGKITDRSMARFNSYVKHEFSL